VVVGGGRRVRGQKTEGEVSSESDPGEEDDEPDDEPGGAAAIGLLLGEEIRLLVQD
jgi:hypothetical protein